MWESGERKRSDPTHMEALRSYSTRSSARGTWHGVRIMQGKRRLAHYTIT
jgi:hypothetical protein